jgi:hypothetical protein
MPERPYPVDVERVDRDLNVLHRGRVGGYLQQVACRRRDPPRQVNVALGEAPNISGQQPHGHTLRTQVDIGMVIRGDGHFADRFHQGSAETERAGPEVGARISAAPQHPPVLDAGVLIKLCRTRALGHALAPARSLLVMPRRRTRRG